MQSEPTLTDLAPMSADDYAAAMEAINFRLTHGPAMIREQSERLKRVRKALYVRHLALFAAEFGPLGRSVQQAERRLAEREGRAPA